MSESLTERLNAILPRVVSEEFLGGSGIGNEIAFYVFDYPPEDELRIREHVRFLAEHIPKVKPGLRVKHINLFDLVTEYLTNRKLLDRCFAMQREKGDEHLLRALAPVLDAEKVAEFFAGAADPDNHDLVIVSGVGSVFPLLRTHNLLNNLHSRMRKTPLVMFYPGLTTGSICGCSEGLRVTRTIEPSDWFRERGGSC